jgi:hypothetical protein
MWWDKYCRRYPEFAPTQKTLLYSKVQPIYEN